MVYLKTYTCLPEIDVFNTIIRHGSKLATGHHLSEFGSHRLFMPRNELIVREDLANELLNLAGVRLKSIKPVYTYYANPMDYPSSFSRFVTSDHIEEKTWQKLKSVRSDRAYFQIVSAGSDTAEHELVTTQIPMRYLDGEEWEYEIDWDPRVLTHTAVAWTSDGRIIDHHLYERIFPELDNPHWFVRDLTINEQLLPNNP